MVTHFRVALVGLILLFCSAGAGAQPPLVAVGGYVPLRGAAYADPDGKAVTASAANPFPVTCANCSGGVGGGGAADGVAQGSATSGQFGVLVQGAVTTAAPSYTNAQTRPLSLSPGGLLRMDGSAVTQPVSAASLPLPAGAATSAAQTTGNGSLASIVTNTTGLATASGQTSAAGKLDQLHADLIAPTPAGELHLGEVGGNQASITVAQTVTAASAYASGNAVGGLITFAGAARVGGGTGLIQSVVGYAKSAQSAAMELWLFAASPTASTCTDKAAFSVAAADFDKVVWVFAIGTWFSAGTPSVGLSADRAIPFTVASGTSLFGCLVTRGTPSFASTGDVAVAVRAIRN